MSMQGENKDFSMLLKSLDFIFNKRKQVSIDIINAFVKRLGTVQMHLPSPQ